MSHRLCGQSPCGLSWSKPARSTAAASLERMGSAWLPSRQNDRVTAARILVVEDSKAIRLPVVTALSAQGFELASAANGGDLEKLLPSFAPDLVIFDVMFPGRGWLRVAPGGPPHQHRSGVDADRSGQPRRPAAWLDRRRRRLFDQAIRYGGAGGTDPCGAAAQPSWRQLHLYRRPCDQ